MVVVTVELCEMMTVK